MPKYSHLALVDQDAGGRVLYEASLVENSTDVNPLSEEAVIMPPFLSFSPSYNLNASVVYANFGTEEDFAGPHKRQCHRETGPYQSRQGTRC